MGGYCLVAPVAHFNPSSGYSAVATPANRAAPHAPLPMQFKLDHAQRQQAREMARAGMTIRQLAEHFSVSRMAIWRALRAEDELEQ